MGGASTKQVNELEQEYAMKISLRHWTRLKEYRDYTDYSLSVSLCHWSSVGDLIRVQQLLKEIHKRAERHAHNQVQSMLADGEMKAEDEDAKKKAKKELEKQFKENLCRVPLQMAITMCRVEILEEYFGQGIDIYPLEYSSFVKHPVHYARNAESVEFLISKGVDVYDSPDSFHGKEFQRALIHHAGDGIGDQALLQHLLQRYAQVGPETAMRLLNDAMDLILRTFYSSSLERLVYYNVDMKVEFDVQISRLDKDALAREFIKMYLDILEMEEPESSYDANVQTIQYKQQYPVIRRLFASGFLRSSKLRQRIEPLFKMPNSPIELVIRAAMIGHKRIAQEMQDVRNLLLDVEIEDDDFIEVKKNVRPPQRIPADVANLIVEYSFGYL